MTLYNIRMHSGRIKAQNVYKAKQKRSKCVHMYNGGGPNMYICTMGEVQICTTEGLRTNVFIRTIVGGQVGTVDANLKS